MSRVACRGISCHGVRLLERNGRHVNGREQFGTLDVPLQ
jgi:hypothetical protein